MKTKQPTRSLRDQITAYLARHAEATAKTIATHTTERDFPSRVLNELNRMRTDALVECEKRKGKGNEYYYWLVARPAQIARQTGETPQPEVGENTGSDGSAVIVPDASSEAVAVQEPAPAAAAPNAVPVAEDDTEQRAPDFARDPELQYLAPEDYELPPADPALLASANRMLSERLDGVAHVLRGCGLPALVEVTGNEDLQPHAAALSGAFQMARAELAASEQKRIETTNALTRSMQDLDTIREILAPFSGQIDPSDMTEVELAECAAKAIRATLDTVEAVATGNDAVDVLDAATAYLVRAPKRRPRIVTKPQSARDAALAAARNGAGRADVFALVHVGSARRGAEWQEPQ